MDIKRIGQYTQPVAQTTRQQPASGAPVGPVAPQAPPQAPPKATPKTGSVVHATDLLTDEERGYLEMLFPGATAVETYSGQGKTPAPPTGSIVDRKG